MEQIRINRIYFIIPESENFLAGDTRAMQAVGELNKEGHGPVSLVVLCTERNFPILRGYCLNNKIPIKQEPSPNEYVDRLLDGGEKLHPKVVFVTDRSKQEGLAGKLKEYDFEVQTRLV